MPPAKRPVPVFPLPSVVLFPGVLLPLHIFELRYRTLVRDALSGERTLALATLKPGWERDYQGSPEFHELGCLARFEEVEWLPNDCYDLKLEGVVRVRFVRVLREFPYRACEVEEIRSAPYDETDPWTLMERQALLETTTRLLPLAAEAWLAPPITAADARFETVVNSIAQAARIPVDAKLELLAMDSVIDRSRRLHDLLRRRGTPPPTSPMGGREN